MLTVGVEDGSFIKGRTKATHLVGVLFKGTEIDNVRITRILVDGFDATQKLIKLIHKWSFDAVFLAGVSFAGFNTIDPAIINETFKVPVIVVVRTKPNNKNVKWALQKHFKDWRRRWNVFSKLGSVYKVTPLSGERPLYVEVLGANIKWACNLIRALTVYGKIPEPLRVAKIIAHGLS